MVLATELEQRLKALEIEQEQQSQAVNDLGEMDEIIRNIEAALAKIDDYHVKQSDNSFERDELEETRRMERELEQMQKLERIGKSTTSADSINKSSPKPSQKTVPMERRTNQATASYVIRLAFNPKSPQEWSGRGWCEAGKGLRYSNPDLAKQTLQKLKKRWPGYPLKLLKSEL